MTHTKANISKILTLILGLTMCLALMLGIVVASPTSTVYAEGETLTPYDIIYINNNPLNNGYYLKTSDGDQLNGNPDTGYVAKYKDGVLTLNNFNGGNVGINPAVSGYFTINLIGDNIITGGQNGVFIDGEHEGRVTITSNANGKLTINASSSVSSVWGIACGASVMAKNIDVVIGGNAQVTINATSNGENCQVDGIHARNVTIEDNASVNIVAKNTNNSTASQWVAGIFAKNNVTINTNGNIDIDVSVAGGDSAYSYGIRNCKTMTKAGNMTIKYKKAGSNGWPITGGDVDNTTHAVNEDSGNCFASYRYGTPRYVAAINGTLAGPGVPKEANSGSGYFLAGDEITLNAPSLQVSETDTTNIPFDKWFSFTSDAVITNATSQNGAKLTVQDKDIEVRANYKAFTVQPVFERESGTKGTVTFTLISNEFNQSNWIKIRPINDLTISKGNVVSVDGTTYKATLEDNGTYYGTPAGEYVVEVEYNNKTLYSAPFTIDYTERKATVDSVTIFGEQGETIANKDITVTLTGYTFATALSGNWITNLPAGLVQTFKRISDTEARITVSGTPTALSDQVVNITIPKANITGLTSDLTAKSNSDAKFNIVATLTEIAVPTAKTGLTYTNSEITGVDDGVGYTLTGNKGVAAKNYTAIAKLKSGYKWNDGTITDKEIPWSIGKRNPVVSDFNFNEPSNLTYDGNVKTATVSLIAHYGDETGYTVTVKYKKGGVIVAEAKDAGEYEVYIDTTATANFNSATDIHDVSWKFTIAKAEQPAPSSSLFTTVAPTTTTTTDGKITGITAKMEYRKVGDSAWTSGTGSDVTGLSSGRYQIRFKETDNYNAGAVTEVDVPESGVSSYNLTVIGGTGEGVFIQGASVTITANEPTIGKKFSGWTIEGISGLDTTKTSLTFNMPANAVTATANYEDIEYTITVNGGTADKSKAKCGESVTITANVPATGKEFDKWVVTGITLSDEDLAKSTVTFQMPASDVKMEATYKDVVYQVTVENGTTTLDMATYQTEVTVKANEPDTDMYFDKWEVTGLDTEGMDLTKTEIKFNMPDGNVTFKATYRAIEKFAIEMVDGTKDKEVAKAGETVTITANPAPAGKVFDKWTCETAGVTIEFESATSSTTTFEMPASNIKIQAHFRAVDDKPSVEIKVEGGTGAGVVKQGESITVTANDPAEGKEFKGWKDESGEIVSTEKSYTFNVTGEKTLTAVYGDKTSGGGEITPTPDKKDGLSGGQIAGIVIGSVLLAGIGGFAVLWFAVKKKSFADLIAAIKALFTKKNKMK
ncbi:putative uncharacterized protein [Faecalibacterium sp. CAG:1138]|nr:putative uncharacterized protein [Faecalibacterium sp. CAG:1138]